MTHKMGFPENAQQDVAELRKTMAALETLRTLGYSYQGGTLWKPPLGPRPNFDYAEKLRAVANAADVVMHHFADSHWHEGSFSKMVDAMEPLRLALIAAGYGLPPEDKKA